MNKILLIFLLIFSITNSFAKEKVTLQLKWFHQFQFAGYYAAKEKGFYEEVGLDVEIKQRDLKQNNIQQVIDNEAQYGIADSILFLYKQRKEPIVIVSPIFQHSANVLLSRKDSKISSVYDLDNKNMIFYPNDSDGFSILALLKKFNSKPSLLRIRAINDHEKLINKEADLMPAYITNEPFFFKQKGIDINIINPMNYGIDIYGDMLFTNQEEALNHPNRVKKFKKASLKGWKYALENPEEIIKLIKNKYNSNKSLEHLRYEARALKSLINKDTTPLGYLDKGRVKYIAQIYKEYGLLKDDINLKNFIFEDYIDNNNLNLTKEEKEYLSKKEVLKVQSLKSFPPYNFVLNNKPQGYTIEYMRLIADILDIKIEFVKTESWKKSLEMIKTGEVDIIPHVARNSERENYIDYTNFSHIYFQTALGVRKNSQIKSLKDLKGKTLSLLDNSFIERIIREKYPSIKILEAKTTQESIEHVSNNEADATIGNLTVNEYFINNEWLSNIKTIKVKKESLLPTNVPLFMGVKKDNLLLKSILEKAKDTISQNKASKLKTDWLNKKFEGSIDFSKSEYAYLSNKKSINYCIDPNWMPLEMIKDNKHIGLSHEYIKILEEKLDLNFNFIKTKTWTESLQSLEKGSCEFIPFINKTKKREEIFDFSKQYLSFPLILATKTKTPFIGNLKDIGNKKVAHVKNYAYKEILQKEYPNINFVNVDSIQEGLKKVENSEVYALIGLLPTLGHEIQKNFANTIKISGKINESMNINIAVKKGETTLLSAINKSLASISEEKKQTLYNKWNLVTYESQVDYEKILAVIAFFITIILVFIYKNRQVNSLYNDLRKYTKIIDEHVLTSTTDLKGNITYVSKAFCEISGYTKEELLGKNHRIIRHPDMSEEFFQKLWKDISSGKSWKGEIKNRAKDGSFYWVSANISPVFNRQKQIVAYTAIRHEITDKKRIEEISITDELTGLYNRRHFNEVFEIEINRAKREENHFALIIFDVDCFKQYNDNYGHQKGDFVLKEIGKAVRSLTKRSSDFGFRIGGEEFAIIFKPHFKENALEFAQTVNKKIRDLKIEHKYNKADKYITVSVGLYVEFSEKIEDSKSIYNHTDCALYEAKEKGRNQFILYKKSKQTITSA